VDTAGDIGAVHTAVAVGTAAHIVVVHMVVAAVGTAAVHTMSSMAVVAAVDIVQAAYYNPMVSSV